MHMRPVLANMGLVLQLAGILVAFPIMMGFIYNETQAIIALFVTGFAFFATGFVLNALSIREWLDFRLSCMLLTGTFFVLGFIGSIPYFWLNVFNDASIGARFVNSFFESISGYTTTGFTLITNIDALPRSIVFYRSFTHLVGGIGIVLILLAFFYRGKTLEHLTKVINLVGGPTNSIKKSLISVLEIYVLYVFLLSGLFYALDYAGLADSISVVLSAFMTGGFTPTEDMSKYIFFPSGGLLMLMMFLGATSFFIHHRIFSKRFMSAITKELVAFILIIIAGIIAVQAAYPVDFSTIAFNVVSASTTTGFSTMDFSAMADNVKLIFIALMFIGGMSISTAGGIKVFRVLLLFKAISFTIGSVIGRTTDRISLDGHEYCRRDIITNLLFIILSGVAVIAVASLLTFEGFSLADSLFEATSAFSTVGLTAGIISVSLATHLKAAFILLMVLGRVEIIAFLVAVTRMRKPKSHSPLPPEKDHTQKQH